MQTLVNQINTAREMKNSKAKRKEFNDRIAKITNKYQKIYNFKINKNYPGHETWNNEADAFKHTFGAALMEFEMGSLGSLIGGIHHESQTESNPKNEWNMDSWNNREGRKIAKEIKKEYGEKKFKSLSQEKQEDIIAHKVITKMKNGDLITAPEDKRKFKGAAEKTASIIKEIKEKNEKYKQKGKPTGFASPITNSKTNFKIDFNNVEMDGKKYKNWSKNQKDNFWKSFESNSFTNSVKQISTIKTTKTETSKMNLKGSNSGEGHWVTLKNGNHVLIED